jgi:hypothetical protein
MGFSCRARRESLKVLIANALQKRDNLRALQNLLIDAGRDTRSRVCGHGWEH